MLRRQEAEQVRRAVLAVARGRPPGERGGLGVGGDGDEDNTVAAGYTGARRHFARLRDLRRRRWRWRQEAAVGGSADRPARFAV